MNTTSLFSRAMQFHSLGYAIIPVNNAKKPLVAGWKQYQKKMPTETEIEKWWNTWPEANIGIITGEISNLSVIDLDTNGGTTTPTSMTIFPATYTVRTGNGGYHLYYTHQDGLKNSARGFAQYPGLDIRSEGGYVVGPYSTTNYEKDGKPSGGVYEVIDNSPVAKFPAEMFSVKKPRVKLSAKVGVQEGGRNALIASFIGQLLHSARPEEWETEVWPAVVQTNKTYKPPLSDEELRATFESIVKLENERRESLIVSPIQLDDGEVLEVSIRKNGNGVAYKDMANVLAVLSQHPYYKNALRYNEFRQEIEYNGRPFEESDLVKIQYFMQTAAELHGISKEAVHSAVQHYANQNAYDEAKEWLSSLVWDGVPRLHNWIHQATGVMDDDYHAGIGAQWFMGMVRRVMQPGAVFDYVLLLVGPQGIGKTSFFRILGGPWYKSYTGAMDNKDFFLALRGALIVDLDEGAALYKSEAIKIKSMITETHDEYRAPYDRVMKKYPRRFVFSMSTNDTEPFRDATGNRRYWPIDAEQQVNFKWLEDNRDQIFAEAYVVWRDKLAIPEVPMLSAMERQEQHLPEDSWTDLVLEFLRKNSAYCKGDADFFTTTLEVYLGAFPKEENMARVDRKQEMRIANILRSAGFEVKRSMIDGERRRRWMLTAKRAKELQEQNLSTTRQPLEDEFND